MNGRSKDLRTWEPTAGDAKDVDQTKMLDVKARETPDTVSADSKHVETVRTSPGFGKLGMNGRS